MKIRFEEKQDIPENDPCVVIQAKQLSDQAREVMDYLEQFSTVNQVVIPIKTDDHLIMVKIDDIILAEIDKNQLTIYTTDKTFTVRDTLTNFQHRINRRNFLQISRHAVMNIDHLESLSDSFSGNMMAKTDTWSKIKCQSEICQILDGLFRGIGESDETSYSLFCIWYEDRILLLFVFGVIIPCLSQHRLSRCKCPQHPSDLFDEWDNGGLDIHS